MSSNAVPMQDSSAGSAKKGKQAIEHIYQKKTQLEHILLRPDTYIGSVQPISEKMWVFEDGKMEHKQINYVPGLYKIFDEILVNAADNKQRDPNMDTIKIDIDQENNSISIYNNGKGIPIVEHKDEKMFVPTMIFGHLLTSSNFNDDEKKVTGGRNGYGAKLCNVFSTKFTVETANRKEGKVFKQNWENNMSKAHPYKILDRSGDDYTKVTFKPDLKKFNMDTLDNDIVALFQRRAYDVAGTSNGVKVFLNGKRLPIKTFKEYVDLFLKDLTDDTDKPIKAVHEKVNDRWEVAVCSSEDNFKQISFVNSIATSKGGRHVDYIADQVARHLVESANKKNKGGILIKPGQIRNHLWVFINCLIENPTFDSQTKETMTLQAKMFGSKCTPSDKFFSNVVKSGIVESVLSWAKFKQDQIKDKQGGKKTNKVKGIAKLEDANDAGTRFSLDCTLILTEGDSAKALAVAGLGVIGRDKYGVFPLRGKLLNVREASHKQIIENAEINAMVKILGLKYKQQYKSSDDMKTLRYGKLMIMTDQDHDGSHIKGLIINFIHHNWPSLLQRNFIEEFITPIVKVSNDDEVISFYSLPELEEWKKNKPNWKKYKIKYYKGLGTSTSNEGKQYFKNIERHRIKFRYNGAMDDDTITMAFSKKCIEQRKDWLTNWMDNCKRRKELGLSQEIIYGQAVRAITYTEFVNKELVLFSNLDNERSIPSLVDGLKPGQRKVLFTCFKRNDKKEVKVAQLAGSVAEHSAYHHGEQSLMSTIINLAQNYIGSNNINLLEPNGQFGTRLQGGKDSASSRYIFTMLSPLARLIFDKKDNPILRFLYDDNQKIEPEWYCPIIPMVLVNGADGIGTGWMTKLPNFNPREIVHNIRKMIRGEEPELLHPWYKNFLGEIMELNPHKYAINGEISILSDEKVEITELPVGTWTQAYKESVIEPMVNGSEKVQPIITSYKEYNTDTTVRFVLTMKPDILRNFEKEGLHRALKLQTTTTLTSMVLFDKNGCLKRYDSVNEILKEFFVLRFELYVKRREYLIGMLTAEALKLSNQARFIIEKCDGDLVVENKKKKVMIDELIARKYDSDPVKIWQEHQKSLQEQEQEADERQAAENVEEEVEEGRDYDYLLGMKLWSLTLERKQAILKDRDGKHKELEIIQSKTPANLYDDDLDAFMREMDRVEKEEKEEEANPTKKVKPEKGKGRALAVKSRAVMDTCPSPMGERVRPVIDELLKREEAKSKVKRGPRVKKTKKEDLDSFDLMADDKESLFDKINSSTEGKKVGKKVGGKKKDSVSDGLKQTKLNFGKVGPKKAKTFEVSGSSDSGSDGLKDGKGSPQKKKAQNDSDSDSDSDFQKPKKGKKAAPPRNHIDVDSDSDVVEKKPRPIARRAAGKPSVIDLDSDSDSLDKKPKANPKKSTSNMNSDSDAVDVDKGRKGSSRKAAPKFFETDSGDSDSNEQPASRSPRPNARTAAAKRKPILLDSGSEFSAASEDSGSDDDFTPSPSKKRKV